MRRKDIINNNIINVSMLQNLVNNINENHCYDKVGELFYVVEGDITNIVNEFQLVNAFLDDLELRPSTSRTIGYEYTKELMFEGFKYSQATDMFYGVHNTQLYKLPAYKRNDNAKVTDAGKAMDDTKIVYTMQNIDWEPSEFKDINGMSDNWVEPTPLQTERFALFSKWQAMLDTL
jgi:hypothetical protein